MIAGIEMEQAGHFVGIVRALKQFLDRLLDDSAELFLLDRFGNAGEECLPASIQAQGQVPQMNRIHCGVLTLFDRRKSAKASALALCLSHNRSVRPL